MRVLLADDHGLFRAGLAALLRASGHEVVGEAADGAQAVDRARQLRPDLVLIDLTMPGVGGLEAIELIRNELPDARVVVVTVSEDEQDLFEAIRRGAQGYLLKAMSEEELSRTLACTASGDAALSTGLASKVLAEFSRLSAHRGDREDPLTPREQEVLGLLVDGRSNKEIAEQLVVTQNTVHFHVKNILAKLGVRNRAQAAAYAVRSGLADARPNGR